jgi:hypothetical protein
MLFENVALWVNVWKYGNLIQVTDYNAVFVQVIHEIVKDIPIYLKHQTNGFTIRSEWFSSLAST